MVRLLAALVLVVALPSITHATGAQYVHDPAGRLVQVIAPDGTSAQYTYDPAGNLLAITPLSATTAALTGFSNSSAAPGTTLTLYGSGFSTTPANNAVSFNGVTATVVSSTANSLTVIVPDGTTSGPITVTDTNGTVQSTSSFNVVTAPNAPTISSFSPQQVAAGTAVTVNGTNFSATPTDDRVFFAGVAGTVLSASTTSLVASVPAGGSSGKITVQTPNGLAVSSTDLLFPLAEWAPVPVIASTRLTINGDPVTINLNTPGGMGLVLFDGTAGQPIIVNQIANTFPGGTPGGLTAMGIWSPGPASYYVGNVFIGMYQTFTLQATGTYTFYINPTPPDTGSLTLSITSPPVNKSSIQIDGPSVTVSASAPGQHSQLTLTATAAAQPINIAFSGLTYQYGCLEQTVTVTGPAPLGTYPPVATGNMCSPLTVTLPAAGTYTIDVAPWLDNTGQATLSVTSVPVVTGSIAVNGSPVTVNTTTPGQRASLSFTTTSPNESVLVQNSGSTYPNDETLVVTGPAPLTTVVTQLCTCNIQTLTLPTVGTYTLTLVPSGSDTGSIALQLSDLPPVTASIAIDGPPVTGTTTVPGQQLVFTFTTTTNNETINVQQLACTYNDCWDGMMDIDGPPPANAVIQALYMTNWMGVTPLVTLPTPGTYTITVVPYGLDNGSLTLQLQSTPLVAATAVIGGDPVTLTTTVPGQQSMLNISTTSANQGIFVVPLNDTYGDDCINDPNNSGQTSWMLTGPSPQAPVSFYACAPVSAVLPTPGTYHLTLTPSGTFTGSMTVQVSSAPPVTGTLSVGGAAVTTTTTIPGQHVQLTINNSTPLQNVTLSVSACTYPSCDEAGLRVSGPGPSGPPVWFTTTYGMHSVVGLAEAEPSVTMALSQTGTYTLDITPFNTDTGSVTLQLSSN